ncbi:DUF6114 domain-containing protein [Kutzneria albida]|uniref:DUF6114 domain-containing protein n=1 Tax=Kutzneria albida TaxID=43357 RepID=UPI00046D3985|nr:DUF6114 domain-containing protein [Kutzneria albida]
MLVAGVWQRFGGWRRGRPFWAGIFLALGGLVIVFPPFASLKLGDLAISISTLGGVSGLLIGVLLEVCALSLLLRPQFRAAAAITAMILSLIALVTSNLGGFLLGTLLGVVGSALAMSWTTRPRRRPRTAQALPPAAVVLAGALLAGLLLGNGGPSPVTASAAAPVSSTTTSTTAVSTTPSSTTPASTTTSAKPTTTTTVAPPPAPPAGSRAWTLNASRLRMSGLNFGGVVDAVLSGQVVKVLQFTASDLEITNLVQTADFGNGHKIVTSAAPGSTSTVSPGSRVTLLTQRLKGNLNLLGIKIPVDYSAASPPPLTIPLVTFTEVTVTNTDLRGGVLRIPGARIVAS